MSKALDVIRRIDNQTLGIPKIIYLVGWQYNGHDSKYPAWFGGNETLKRPQDANSYGKPEMADESRRKIPYNLSVFI
jgi:hypothetical protein